MKKIIITYLSLLLVLSSLFSFPVSVLANTQAEPEAENVELEVTEDEDVEESRPSEDLSLEEPPDEIAEEEADGEIEEETTDEKPASEIEEEETDEERHGFSLAIEAALNADGNLFTAEEGLDPEESFTLRLESILNADQNYKEEDIETATLPASVNVAEAEQGTVESNGNDIATYQVHTNGEIEFTFLKAVESAGAVNEPVDIEVYINENSIDEEFAYIAPIESEEQIVIPLLVEEKQGFSLAIEEALDTEGNVFTEEEGLDPEEAFTLRVGSILAEDQNYEAGDVESAALSSSVEVAESTEGTIEADGTEVATYIVNSGGEIEVTFLEGVETVDAAASSVDVEVLVNEDSVDEEYAYIAPIDAEEQLVVPLAVDEESEEATEEESEEGESAEEEADESAEAEEENERSIGTFAELDENLLSSFEFSIIDSAGNQTNVENDEELEVNLDNMNAVQLIYGLTKPDEIEIAEGDTYTIDLPSIFGSQAVSDMPIIVDGTEVATYSIVDGQVEITFNENVNEFDNVEMNVNLTGTFNTDVFEESEEVVVEVPFRDGTSYTATIRAEQQDYDGTDAKEAGSPYILDENDERVEVDRNPEFIDWTVRVNDSMNSFDNATVIDDLGENLEIEEGSFIVERIIRNYNNEEIGREIVDVTPAITDSGFELDLGDIEDAYDITYTTSITRPDGGGTHSINNDARIILDGEETTVSDGFEGTWSGDVPTITKEGAISEGRSDVIDWTVEYNFGQESLGEVSLTDTLTHGEVDLDSVVVTLVDTDIDGNIIDGSGTPVEVSPVLTDDGVTIPGLDADGQAYLITFSSSVPVGLNDTVINTISDDLPNPNADDASVDVNTIPTGGKVGEQYVDEDGAPYIEWTITMNSEKIDVNSINITDVFDPRYLDFDVNDGSLYELYRDGEEAANFDIQHYDHEEDERTGFTLGITDAGPHTYEFVYRTYYTVEGMQEPELANNAELIFEDGDGVGIGESVEIDFNQTGPNAGIQKSGQYLTSDDATQQEIEWTVTFNESNILLNEGSTLTDTFTSGNYEYIADSLAVTTDDNSGLDYTFSENDDGFVITLDESSNATVTVTYRTTTDDTDNLPHVNEATLEWQGGEENADATVSKRDPGISKSGEVVINDDGSKTINWTVDFNTNANILHDVVITENLQPESSVITDIQVNRAGVPLGDSEYTINNPGPDGESFTVEMDRLDAVPYQLTYSSTLSPEEEIGAVNNTVNIDYTGGGEESEYNIPSPELGVQKEAINIDKESERINWSILANTDAANHLVNLVNPVLTDTIPTDQQLVPDSIEVLRADNNENITESLTITEDINDFSINLPDGPYQYIVTFQTEILEFPAANTQLDRYTNTTFLSNEHHENVSDDAYIDYFADGTNNNNTKTGEVNEDTENIDWQATVNPLGLTINNAIITDTLSTNQTYVEDSIVVTDESGEALAVGSYSVTLSDDNQSFTIEFLGDGQINQPINVSYSTRLNPELIGFYDVSNMISLSGGEEQRELSRTTESTSTSQWSYGGGGSGRTLEFTLEKLHENGATPIPGATFEFIRVTSTGTEVPIDNVVTTEDDGSFLIEGARAGRYIVNETAVPDGYEQLMEPFHIIIGYAAPDQEGDYTVTVTDENWSPITSDVASADGNTLTVYNALETGSVSATKDWVDAEESNYPATWFMLYRNLEGAEPEPVEGAEIKEINSDSSSTEVTWENIEMTAPDLEPYIFSVQEVDSEGNDFTPAGFTKVEDGLTVTNTATFTEIDVSKQWNDADNQDGIRPDGVDVQLTADGTPVGDTIELNEENDWSHTFEDLREYSGGSPIEYSVEEVNIPEGYDATINVEDDGNITVTNTHTPETMDVSVSKVWDDSEDQDGVRPNNVTVNLLDGSRILEEVVLNEGNGWEYTFTDLPRFNNGEEVQYSVTEDTVANYSTSIETTNVEEGLDSVVTNTYTPEETTATVTKVWDDGNNQDGNRPAAVTVQLLANGEPHGEPVELTTGDWTYTWTGLDLNAGGEAIDYTVEEIEAPEGYEVSVNNDDHGNLVITNSYEPEVTDISVSKTWDDADDQDGVRPGNVRINLLADGEIESMAIVDAAGDWTHTFTDLPVNNNGVPINYTITENTVAEYSTEIEVNPEADNEFTVTNTHTPDETSVTVTKSWDDANNQDGNRPGSIDVQLTADGEAQGDPVTITAADDWSYTWAGLDVNADGAEIEYSVEELNVDEQYSVSVNDENHGNIIITNSYTPELTEVPVTKVWDDADDQDGERPSQITLNLLNERGEIVRSAVVQEQEGNEWEYTFTNIPRYDNGTEISYSVTENFVSDYSTTVEPSVDGNHVVTNSYTPDETSVTVTKGWNDSDDQDGERPGEIEVQLTADDEAIGDPQALSEENNWTHTWNELALNSDGEAINYSVEEVNVPEGYSSSINDADHGNIIITNSYTPSLIDIPVEKVWEDENDQDRVRPGEVIANLINHEGEIESRVLLNEDNDWQHTFTGLPEYANGELINYTITENSVDDYSTTIDVEEGVNVITNSYTPEETTVTVTKGWDDGNNQDGNRPGSIEVQLLADGEPQGDVVEITAEDNWTYTWTELDANADGEAIEYSVEELNTSEEYDVILDDEDHGNIILVNSYTPEVTEISGTKTWDDADDQDGVRPDTITVNLLADGDEADSAEVSEETDWTYSFSDLPVYEAGEEIEYTIEEVSVEGYETTYDETGYNITNVHTPELTEITGQKTWDDVNNQDGKRPDTITVNLLADGQEVDSIAVSEETDWTYSFTDLPVFEAGGEIEYTIEEVAVEEYETTIDGFDITNTHTPETTDISGTKTWDDGDNQDGNRPDSITVNLLAGEEQVDSIVVSDENDWTYSFTDLPVFEAGEEIEYTIEEVPVEEYETTIDGFDITNTYTPETTEVSVSKVWDDSDDQDDIRPNNVTVNLLNGSEIVTEAVLNEDNDWQHTFTDLPVYAAGEEIQYSVTENTVVNYSTSIETNETDEGLESVVTNTYTPEETTVTVTKLWDDVNNQDGNRPANIDIQLIADGEALGDPQTLSVNNNWTYTWTGLSLNDDGQEIDYSVEEVNVPDGYSSTINDADHGNIIVTNSYTPELTEVPVTKVWDDADNQDDNRPESITLNLLNDRGEIVRQAVVQEQEGNEWEYTFTNIPRYENGTEINYSVTENFVSDYSTAIEQNENGVHVVTNSYTPDETSVTVTKGWNDADDQDGERPENIEVQLTADGEAVGDPQALSEENNWTYTWDELALNSDGQAVAYSVEELNVPGGYSSSINDANHGNIIVTNDYTPSLIDIPVEKVWDDAEDQDRVRPGEVIVNLNNGQGELESRVILNESNDWQYTFSDLPEFENGELINYTVTENSVEDYSTNIEENEDGVRVITNSYTPEETSVTVTKGWDDGNDQDGNRPDGIEVQLLADGETEGDPVEITAEDNWTYTWQELDANADGEAIEYSVEELNVPEAYEVSLNDEDHGNITLINSYVPETTEVSGTKTWNDADDQDGARPDYITVNLLADGETIDTVYASPQSGWQYSFEGLPVYNNGEEITYSVEEAPVDGYEAEIDGFDITNTHEPETTEVTVSKVWEDNDDQDGVRPEAITVNLLNNIDAQIDEIVLSADNDWQHTFTDLPKYANGAAINYTVTENSVTDYSTSIVKTEIENGTNHVITNEYTPGETSVTATKVWDDANNQDGNRSDNIEIQLTADGEAIGEPITLSEANSWTHTWAGLDEMADGQAIDYSVIELNVPESYEVDVNDDDHGNIIITNSYTPETTEVSVSKVWDDNDNQDDVRPDNVTVNLLDGSEIVTEAVLNADNDWQHTFSDLPVYENGEEIQYSVTENTVTGYSTTIDTTATEEGLSSVVTNAYTPEETTATVTKVWNDGNNQDGNRPESVTVQLLANGEAYGDPVTLSAPEAWTHTWNDLDLNSEGEAIEYTVQELEVPEDYEVSINNNDHGNLMITNTYAPEITEVSVSKVWEDGDNQDNVRPDNVIINLLADGEIERTAVVDADGEWQHTFTNLPVYDDGNEINYTVTENTVEHYSASIVEESENNFIVTNTHTPDETSVTVTKGWNDSNNQDGNRPESIEVQLTANGEVTGEPVTLSEENNWTNTWNGLALNNDGKTINYSVEELDVPEKYSSSVNDADHGNIIVTNSYTPETIDIPVKKVWDDSDNQDGVRPNNVTVNLVDAEGKVIEQVILSEENEWQYTFTGLPANAAGEAISYTVTENAVTDYSTSIAQNDDGVNVITNTYTPEETSVTVTKGWKDKKNKGARPDSVEVQLTADGEAIGEAVTLSAENDWTHTWNGLAEKNDGTAMEYSVEELNVPEGYKASIYDANHGNIIVVNSYTAEKPSVPGTDPEDPEDPSEGEESPEDPKGEGTPGTEEDGDTPEGSTGEGTPGSGEGEGTPEGSTGEGTPGSGEEEGTPEGSTGEGTPGSGEGEGTPEGSTGEGAPGSGEGEDTALPLTGVALGSTMAVIAAVFLAIGGALLFFARRRNN